MPRFSIGASKLLAGLKRSGLNLMTKAKEVFNRQVKSGNYDLRLEIMKHPFLDTSRPARAGLDWWIKWRKENAKKYSHSGLMEAGKMYNFKYPNPKHKDTLDYWDVNPLIICLGHYKAKNGDIITQGLNLHLLPEKIRRETMIKVFDIFKQHYRGQMYDANQRAIDSVQWQVIAEPLRQFGASFSFRSYIPKRQIYAFEIPFEMWSNAVFVPSEKYHGIAFTQLKGLWKEHLIKEMQNISADRLEKAMTDRYI